MEALEFHIEYIPLIVAAVEAVKEITGLSGKWVTLTAILMGVAFSLGMDFLPNEMAYVIRALSLGLAVPGLYVLGKRAGTSVLNALGK